MQRSEFYGFYVLVFYGWGSGSILYYVLLYSKPVLRIRIHQSEVWIRILLSSCKNSKKNLDSYYFVNLVDFLSLKNDVNVPYLQKVISRKNCVKKLVFCWHLEGQWRKQQDPDPGSGSGSFSQRHGSADPNPDPPQNVMDPQHCFKQWNYFSA